MKKVLMFSAAWCSPCKASKPVFNNLKESKSDYEYQIVDVDENPTMATNFEVTAVPTFVIMDGDTIVERIVGDIKKLKDIL